MQIRREGLSVATAPDLHIKHALSLHFFVISLSLFDVFFPPGRALLIRFRILAMSADDNPPAFEIISPIVQIVLENSDQHVWTLLEDVARIARIDADLMRRLAILGVVFLLALPKSAKARRTSANDMSNVKSPMTLGTRGAMLQIYQTAFAKANLFSFRGRQGLHHTGDCARAPRSSRNHQPEANVIIFRLRTAQPLPECIE